MEKVYCVIDNYEESDNQFLGIFPSIEKVKEFLQAEKTEYGFDSVEQLMFINDLSIVEWDMTTQQQKVVSL